ncbi:MAG: c-type cytochrome [Pirellulales bacterium]
METRTPFRTTIRKIFIRRQHGTTLVHPPLRLLLLIPCLLLVHSVGPDPDRVKAQDTPDFFRNNCFNCHTIGGGRLTGPDLKGVLQRQKREWLVNFMIDPRGVLSSGDAYAQRLFEESGKVPMPNLPGMTRERAEKLLNLIEDESKLEKSKFKGTPISNKPFTDVDRSQGRDLFLGVKRLQQGGSACISCHSVHGLPALGGGRLGPDLTNIFERLKGRKSLSAWLGSPATETMQPIFKEHPLTQEEIFSLVAYFKDFSGEQPASPSGNRVTFLLLGLVLSSALVLVFDSLWKERFSGVRRSLVEQSTTHKPNSPQEH